MTRGVSRVWGIGAATIWFAACGGTSTLKRGVPTGDDDSDVGAGGTSPTATGGSPGRAGTASGRGGSSAGVGGGSARGGTAGKAGKGGQSGQGGDAGTIAGESGAGGSSGTAGDAGGPTVDPSCDCTTHDHQFSCTSESVTVPSGFADPASCSLEDTAVKRESCSGRVQTRYTFVEGGENEYRLERDGDGHSTYFSASGYVAPGCGLDASEFEMGSVRMGTPTEDFCYDACALCGDYEDLAPCHACTPYEGDPNAVIRPLEDECKQHPCPVSVADALTRLTIPCADGYVTLRTGCGLDVVRELGAYGSSSYYFNHATGALQGTESGSDTQGGPCGVFYYVAGSIDRDCSFTEVCRSCTGGTGEAGAAGVGGASDGMTCDVN
jgi:hypothetical protein